MGFLAAYKHLEKLCGEVMGDERRISAYIDEMAQRPRGAALVQGWEADLRKLKHYRWVRNQIVHDPNCSEETMCGPEDALWLEDFYDRIMEQTDPLALYRRAVQTPQRTPTPVQTPRRPLSQLAPAPAQEHRSQPHTSGKPTGCAFLLLAGLLFAALMLL